MKGCRLAGCWRRPDTAIELRSIRRCPTGRYPLCLISGRKGSWCTPVRIRPGLRRVRLTVSSTPFKRRHEGSTPSRGTLRRWRNRTARRPSKPQVLSSSLRRRTHAPLEELANSPGPQPGDCGFEPRTEYARNMAPSVMGRQLAFQAGRPGSSPGGATAGSPNLVWHQAHILKQSGFKSQPRNEYKPLGSCGGLPTRLYFGNLQWHVVQWQDAFLLRRSWEFESLRASNGIFSVRQANLSAGAIVA